MTPSIYSMDHPDLTLPNLPDKLVHWSTKGEMQVCTHNNGLTMSEVTVTIFLLYVTSKGSDQHRHPCSLVWQYLCYTFSGKSKCSTCHARIQKVCPRGSNSTLSFFVFYLLVDERTENPNNTKSRPSLTAQ